MSTEPLESIVGLVSKNSNEYVSSAFSLLNDNQSVLNLRSVTDEERIQLFPLSEVIEVKESFGWYKGPKYQLQETREEVAQILFTSGTEGKPKSILWR